MTDLSKAIEMATATHGMVRAHNEDSIGTDASIGLAVLADGMGGYNAGEVASGIAVALITQGDARHACCADPALRAGSRRPASRWPAKILRNVIAQANTSIYQAANSQPQYAGMGTTLVVALLCNNHITRRPRRRLAPVPHARRPVEQLTRDHSLLQEQIDSGMITKEMARRSQNKNLVTRAVGIEPDVEADINTFEATEGDMYLLCSDGLNDMVEDEDILLTLGSLQRQPSAGGEPAGADGERQRRPR